MTCGLSIAPDGRAIGDTAIHGVSDTSVPTDHAPNWLELRDAQGKLQGKWDPAAGLLEIQARGAKTWYWLG